MWDNDGDFLLIEAAYALPRWLKPEVAGNRVWLRQGQVHIIPQPSAKHPTLPAFPSLTQALAILGSQAVETASTRVQAPINERLAEFPGKARASMHRARTLLPASLVRVLTGEPQLVAAAVEAFSSRYVLDSLCLSRHPVSLSLQQVCHDPSPARCESYRQQPSSFTSEIHVALATCCTEINSMASALCAHPRSCLMLCSEVE